MKEKSTIKKWSKKILMEMTLKFIEMRELILDIIDRSLERSKKEGRLQKAKELNRDLLTKQVKEQILIT